MSVPSPDVRISGDRRVVGLDEVGRGDVAFVGGKAANLGELLRAGFPVPRGFCITTAAYRSYLDRAGLRERIAGLLRLRARDDPAALAITVPRVRALVERAAIPDDLAAEIRAAWSAMGCPPVAVRSSATAEDLAGASFAGQHDTYLNVHDPATLIARVHACWTSLWTERAVAYRIRHGFDPGQAAMAVTVQVLVEPDVSGTLFTVDVVDAQPERMVVNAAFGLGEAIVDGTLTPDVFVVARRGLGLVSSEIAHKSFQLVPAPGGGVDRVALPARLCDAPSLARDQVAALAALAQRVEAHQGAPQDIEWAVAGDHIWLLQARPVTALPALPSPGASAAPPVGWIDRFVVDALLDYFPSAPYPFDRSVWLGLVDSALELCRLAGLRPPPAGDLLALSAEGEIRLVPVRPKLTLRVALSPFTLGAHALAGLWRDPARYRRERLPALEPRIAAFVQRDLTGADARTLLASIREVIAFRDQRVWGARLDYIVGGWTAMILLRALAWLGGGRTRPALHADLLANLDTPTTEMHRMLAGLAALARDTAPVRDALASGRASEVLATLAGEPAAAPFLDGMRRFLERFGCRTGASLPYPSSPSWADTPGIVIELVRVLTAADGSGAADRQRAAARASAARTALDAAFAHLPARILGLGRLSHALLRRVRAMSEEREVVMLTYERLIAVIRRDGRQLGARFAALGLLRDADEIRWLDLAEVEAAIDGALVAPDLRSIVDARRARRLRSELGWPAIAAAVGVAAGDTVGESLLRGTPASSGLACGSARVIHGEAEFSTLRRGEVLVCRATSPAWTPLFAVAAGVVTDVGGSLSHAAIVAREFGVPCVLGARSATVRIATGDRVTVDGTRGEVRWRQSGAAVAPIGKES